MTGQDLIDYIEERKLQDRHFFIDVQGYLSTIDLVMETDSGDIILAQEGRSVTDATDDRFNRERYFSEWFSIIDRSEAEKLWESGEKWFLVLKNDGTDTYAYTYENFEDMPEDAFFGLEKDRNE